MFDSRKGRLRDPLLRIAGFVLLGLGGFLMRRLFHAPDLLHHQDPTFGEFVESAAGFLCLSAGVALAVLGAHIFDPVAISERWARRSFSPTRARRAPARTAGA